MLNHLLFVSSLLYEQPVAEQPNLPLRLVPERLSLF